jgi:hypothetical protein
MIPTKPNIIQDPDLLFVFERTRLLAFAAFFVLLALRHYPQTKGGIVGVYLWNLRVAMHFLVLH